MLIKITIELLFIKLAVYCSKKLRLYEGVEVYDTSIHNPFGLLINYEYLNIIENLRPQNENNPNQ